MVMTGATALMSGGGPNPGMMGPGVGINPMMDMSGMMGPVGIAMNGGDMGMQMQPGGPMMPMQDGRQMIQEGAGPGMSNGAIEQGGHMMQEGFGPPGPMINMGMGGEKVGALRSRWPGRGMRVSLGERA